MNKNIKIKLTNKNNQISGKILDFKNFNILINILKENTENEKFIGFFSKLIKDNYSLISVIQEIIVEEKDRNQGKGHELIEKFLKKSEDFCSDFIVVIADEEKYDYHSSQYNEDFSIKDFYEHFGFKSIRKLSHNKDIMIYPSEISNELLDILKINKEKLF